MNRAQLFASVRASVFGGGITQQQVDGVNSVLDACAALGVTDPRHIAYILATPMIETGGAFQPIVENLNYSEQGLLRTFPKYFTAANAKTYAHKPEAIANRAYGNRMGNGPESSGDGFRYRGRGFCQITGHDNYAKFSKLLGADLVGNPDWACRDDIAGKVIVIGMRDGMFTGKKLADYFTASGSDWVNARRIINGLDRADDIASYGGKFYSALLDASK